MNSQYETDPAGIGDVPEEGWTETVDLMVTVEVNVKRGANYEPTLYGRTAEALAATAAYIGREDVERIDGFADLVGSARIVNVDPL